MDDDCVVFLWATVPKLREALQVCDAWGIAYKTHAIWDKEIVGMGYWWRGRHELLLTCTRGSVAPPKPELRMPSVFVERREQHSAKPTTSYLMIEAMFPEATKETRLEMFGRKERLGWTTWPPLTLNSQA